MKIHDFKDYKQQGKKISMITCYDFPSAQIIADTLIDSVLIGDSVVMAVHGHNSTITATMEIMTLHTKAVAKGIKQQFIITDLPFLSYRISLAETMTNIQTLIQAGAHAVKLEGADEDVLNTIKYATKSGIAVMGHIGLMPQSVYKIGGYKIQGRDAKDAEELIRQAQALEDAGCFAIVLECIPAELAEKISQIITIPTIGIGAGNKTDGQILVWHDLLGMQNSFKPKFVKQFINCQDLMTNAINSYVNEIKSLNFPTKEHAF